MSSARTAAFRPGRAPTAARNSAGSTLSRWSRSALSTTDNRSRAPIAEATAKKLWGGRFTGETDPLMHKYNQSLSYDQRMWREDIDGSVVYAKALHVQGIITQQELDQYESKIGTDRLDSSRTVVSEEMYEQFMQTAFKS